MNGVDEPREHHQRRREPARELLGMVQRDGARRELAEHDVQVRHACQRDYGAEAHAQRLFDGERQ